MTRTTAVDRWTLAYAGTVTLALAWRWRDGVEFAALLLLAHCLLVAAALLAPRAREAGPAGKFLGDWYPILLLPTLYTEIGLLNLAGGRVFDPVVIGWEEWLFGGQPSRDWIRAQPAWWLTWPLHLAYLSFYPMVPGAPLALWATGRRHAARRTILLTMVAYYLCFAMFLFFPVAGPRHAFPQAANEATQSDVAGFTQRFLEVEAAWGAAFPSSHVAAALVVSISAGAAWRLLGWVLVPTAVLLTVGTVYGQFHYAVDAVGGIAVAAAILYWGRRTRLKSQSHS